MDIFTLIYWISIISVILGSIIVKRFFNYEGKPIPRIFILMLCCVSFIPIVGSLEVIFGLCAVCFMIEDEDLVLKEHPFKNGHINDFFLK